MGRDMEFATAESPSLNRSSIPRIFARSGGRLGYIGIFLDAPVYICDCGSLMWECFAVGVFPVDRLSFLLLRR